MRALCLALLLATPAAAQDEATLGTLWHPAGCGYCDAQPYHPQEGDLVFFSRSSPFFLAAYGVARSCHPWHVGLVIRCPCGGLALFESGSPQYRGVTITPLDCRLLAYVSHPARTRVWVRRLKDPLTEEQSHCLTAFACSQEGKPFASLVRLGLLGVPCRPLRPTEPDQPRWFCAEIVVEAMRVCGLCPACWICPEKTMPRELFTDKVDISCGWHAPETWSKDCDPPPPGPLCAPP
jgi:hypothetical protein